MTFYAELNQKNASFCYSCSNIKYDDFHIHCHNTYEMYYLLKGDVDVLVEGKMYHLSAHSLILLSSNVLHGIRFNSEADCERYTLHFHPDILSMENRTLLLSAFPDTEKHSRKEVFYEQTQQFELNTFFKSLVACSKLPQELSEKFFPIYLTALLSQINLMCRSLNPSEKSIAVSRTILDIIDYLNEHLNEKITLDTLSERFFISKNYLNRAFRKATGTTVRDYLIYKRVIFAKQLIINGVSAAEAAYQCGFGDYSAFFKAYKKVLGHSPKEDLLYPLLSKE